MGMAASQARYLSLVARKSNCEFEGQQINQARTVLANQSADLFNQMLGLNVPVPPSAQDFTKTQYSFKDGANSSTISSWHQLSTANPNYNYVVTHYYTTNVYTGSMKKLSDPQVQYNTSTSLYTHIGNSELTYIDPMFPLSDDQKTDFERIKDDLQKQGITSEFANCFGPSGNYTGFIYSFQMAGKTYSTTAQDLYDSYNSGNGPNQIDGQNKRAYYNAEYVSTRIETTENALLETDEYGRFVSARFENNTATYALTMETVTDEVAYQDAMNAYNYENAKYDKLIQDINSLN